MYSAYTTNKTYPHLFATEPLSSSLDIYCTYIILYRPKYPISSSVLPLISYLLFFLRSLYYVLCRAKDQTPGTREFQSTFFWFTSRKRHPSVKKVLPLKLSCWFLGAVELLQLATLAECLTSSQTILALFPKTNKV